MERKLKAHKNAASICPQCSGTIAYSRFPEVKIGE